MPANPLLLDYIPDETASLEKIRSEEVLRIEQFSRRELPRLVRAELERRVLDSMSPVENDLRGQLLDIVQDCQARLFRHYNHKEPAAESNSTEATPRARDSNTWTPLVLRAAIPSSGNMTKVDRFLPPSPVSENSLQMALSAGDLGKELSTRGDSSSGSLANSAHIPIGYRSENHAQEPCANEGFGLDSGGVALWAVSQNYSEPPFGTLTSHGVESSDPLALSMDGDAVAADTWSNYFL